MKTLYKEYDYTPERWRKAGRLLNEGGTHYDRKVDALRAFSDLVVALVNVDTFKATLDESDCESLEIVNPRTGEERILSVDFDEYHGYCVSFNHC